MTCSICNDTKIVHTVTGVWPCLKCRDKKSKLNIKISNLRCMFDGWILKEQSLGFLQCPECNTIFLPSVLSDGRQKLEEVYKEPIEE